LRNPLPPQRHMIFERSLTGI